MAGTSNNRPAPPSFHNGSPLPDPVRDRMEQAFGADFSGVRVHANSHAMPPALGAQAFTQGQNIHFAPGQFAPDNQAGGQLLAHELAHVVQQRSGNPLPPALAESQARLSGLMAAAGEPAHLQVPPG